MGCQFLCIPNTIGDYLFIVPAVNKIAGTMSDTHFSFDYMNHRIPPMILCLGLQGSASTWAFNVCAQLVTLAQGSVQCVYADCLQDLFNSVKAGEEQASTYVVKSHFADEDFSDYLSATGSRYVLTVRDPRDCIVSLMERFGFPFDVALSHLVCSCHALMRAQSLNGGLLLRYEDQFFQSRRTIPMLRQYLGLGGEVDCASLDRLNSQESIMEFINTFDELPEGRILKINEDSDDALDVVTQWHRHHFGDGLTGKWRTRLSEKQKVLVTTMLAHPLKHLGYEISENAEVSTHSSFAPDRELVRT